MRKKKTGGEKWEGKKTPHAVHENYSLNPPKAGNHFHKRKYTVLETNFVFFYTQVKNNISCTLVTVEVCILYPEGPFYKKGS